MKKNMFSLADKTAIVTGGAMGIGKAIATAFAEAGANIIVADINQEKGEQTVNELKQLGVDSVFCLLDVRDRDQIETCVNKTVEHFGKIDILMNNAGIGRPSPSAEMSEKDWQDVIDINLTGVFFMAQAVGKVMIKQGFGNIVNTVSMSAYICNWHSAQTNYYAAKAGVAAVTRALAAEWAPYGIRVNGIAPGVTVTDQTDWMFKDPSMSGYVKEIFEWTPLGRPAQPDELTGACIYLASDASSYTTGHVIIIDGGHTIH